jgi:type VI secretion system protein VasD
MDVKPMKLFTAFLYAQLKSAKLLTTTVMLLLLTACSSTDVRLNLSASADLNSNIHSEPFPVMVKVYQLSSVSAFRNASFDQLWQADELILGKDLVDKQVFNVQPNAKLNYEFVQVDGAEYIAMFVMFRNAEQDRWRWLHKLDGGLVSFDTEFDIRLMNNKIYYMDN